MHSNANCSCSLCQLFFKLIASYPLHEYFADSLNYVSVKFRYLRFMSQRIEILFLLLNSLTTTEHIKLILLKLEKMFTSILLHCVLAILSEVTFWLCCFFYYVRNKRNIMKDYLAPNWMSHFAVWNRNCIKANKYRLAVDKQEHFKTLIQSIEAFKLEVVLVRKILI